MPTEDLTNHAGVETERGTTDNEERRGRFHNVVTFFGYAYLLRVPLLIGMVLVALPPLAVWGPLKPLLENLFVLSPGNIFWVMIVALMLAWSLLVTWRLVLLNGEERFGLEQWKKKDTLTGWHLLLAAVPTVSLFVCAYLERVRVYPTDPDRWVWIAAGIAGAAAAYLIGFVALLIAVTLAPRYSRGPEELYKVPFPYGSRLLERAGKVTLLPWNFEGVRNKLLKYLPRDLVAGYVDREHRLWPAHWLVVLLFASSLLIYGGLGAFRGSRLGMPTSIPAITFVLISLLVLNWVLSILAFFLDRYRVPLLLPILLFCIVAGRFPQSDHYFDLRDGVTVKPVSPGAVLMGHALSNNNRVVVVATAGGGIQAAGWTAQVLTGLQQQCQVEYQTNFANSIAAISAVSGGAVGTLFFANQYSATDISPGFAANSERDLAHIVEQAETPALSDVAWALAYVEPPRALFPYFRDTKEEKLVDRGYVLEQTWRNQASVDAYLSNWREGVEEGRRPAVIFNATIAETGQPYLLSTSDLDTGKVNPARQTLALDHRNSDVPVVTATRLAASFPYVSPASRPYSTKPEYHLVDGGYYDNFGVDSLTAWLGQALASPSTAGNPEVLFIQIRSFPSDAFPGPENRGWFYQVFAPVDGLMNVRTTAQLVRDREELGLLIDKWASRGIRIDTAVFEFSGQDAPLSWELNPVQKVNIREQWSALTKPKSAMETVWKNLSPDRRRDAEERWLRGTEQLAKVRTFCSQLPRQMQTSAPQP